MIGEFPALSASDIEVIAAQRVPATAATIAVAAAITPLLLEKWGWLACFTA